jgi:hypothetical protein
MEIFKEPYPLISGVLFRGAVSFRKQSIDINKNIAVECRKTRLPKLQGRTR